MMTSPRSLQQSLLLLLTSAVLGGEGDMPNRGDITPPTSSVNYDEITIAPLPGLFGEYDYGEDDCWSPECHPDTRVSDSSLCSHCPQKDGPSSWREEEDLGLHFQCQAESAKVFFNLSKFLDLNEPWLNDSWVIDVSYESNEASSVERIEDLRSTEVELSGLCSGVNYYVCFNIVRDENEKATFCEDCNPRGAPSYNPSEITVDGGVTYVDVKWKPLELECPDTKYQILVDGNVEVSTETGIDQKNISHWNYRIALLKPGLHNISVRTINTDGPSEGDLTSVTYETVPLSPPSVLGVEQKVVDGSLVAIITWEPTMNFESGDIMAKGYFLTLYNTSSMAEDDVVDGYQILIDIENTSYNLNLSEAGSWDTEFSLQTYLGEAFSEETARKTAFSGAIELNPPNNVNIDYEVVDGDLVAFLSWEYAQDSKLGEGFDGLKSLITLKDGEGKFRDMIEVPWPNSSVLLKLGPELSWDTMVSVQTGVMEGLSEESEEMQLFGGTHLSKPSDDSVKVHHDVNEGKLFANVSWYSSMEQVFDGLETILEVKDKNTGYLVMSKRVPNGDSWVTVGLEEVDTWECEFTLHTAASGGRGNDTQPFPLFSDITLSRPEDVEVKTVVENDLLTALVSWNNTVLGGAEIDELITQVKLTDKDGSIIDAITVPYPDSQFNFSLTNEVPWDIQFVLTTVGKELEGDKTDVMPLFATEESIPTPVNIAVDHWVQDSLLMATISWDHAVEPFLGLETMVMLHTEEGTLLDIPHKVTHTENSFTIGHEDPLALKWGTLYSLRSCVGDAHCGEETEKASLFPDSILTPPKNIVVSHGYDNTYESVYALITWENSIDEEFKDLFTVINTWLPGPDGERKKREIVRYETIFSPFSKTERRIYLLDVDQSTVFSLQAAMGNTSGMVMGEESDVFRLFDESLVMFAPPSDIVIKQSKVINDTLVSDIGWVPVPLPAPTQLNIYGADGELLKSMKTKDKQDTMMISLDGDLPWDATFSLSTSYKPGESTESDKQRLFLTSYIGDMSGQEGLVPPLITNITTLPSSTSSYKAQVSWNHTMEPFSNLITVIRVWRENGSLYNTSEVNFKGEESNNVVLEVEENAVVGAMVSLETRVGEAFSLPGEQKLLFPEERDLLMLILMILALTVLLLLYILVTAFCLRRLCNKSGRLDVRKQKGSQADAEPGTPGVYSNTARFNETKPLMENGCHNAGVPSDAGSDNTDQSLLSEETGEPLCSTPLPPSLLYPGDSMITLNKFNEDDDGFFLGGFNEDGSFIGDYMENDPDTNRIVMNRLVGFNQLFSKKY